MENRTNQIVVVKEVRETEKAKLLRVELANYERVDIWFPKSQIVDDTTEFYEINSWILEQKERELGIKFIRV